MNNSTFSFSDILNESNVSADTLNVNNLIANNITDTALIPNRWVGTDSGSTLESRIIQGTANQVNINCWNYNHF